MLDLSRVREEFPVLRRTFKVFAHPEEVPVIYFDHGASTHPPLPVLDAYTDFMKNHYANIHRGMHFLSQEASTVFDESPEYIARFIGAKGPLGQKEEETIVMCSNTTDAIDLAAFVERKKEGVTVTTLMEHHSNDLIHRKYGKVVHAGLTPEGALDIEDVERCFDEHKVKLLAVTGASNVTGYMPPVHELAKLAHDHNAKILVDGAQMLAHHPVDVRSLDDPSHIDYFAAAGHKSYAPFGSSFLYGPTETLSFSEPRIPGGGTVKYVTPVDVLWADVPDKHQGGTPNIGGVVAFASAIRYLERIGMENVREHERSLLEKLMNGIKNIPGVITYGPNNMEEKIGVVPFNVSDKSHAMTALMLNWEEAIACRNGCFCAHPYLHHLLRLENTKELRRKIAQGEAPTLPGAVRASLGIYNNEEEVKIFLETLYNITENRVVGDYSDLSKLTHHIDFFRTGRARRLPFTGPEVESS